MAKGGRYLINESTTVDALLQDIRPQFWVPAFDEIPCLTFKHLVLIRDMDKLGFVLSFLICNEGQVWIAFLAVLADGKRIVQRILLEELLGIVVAVDVDFGESIVDSRNLSTNRHQQMLDDRFLAVDIE